MKYVFTTAALALALSACSGGSGTDADADGDGEVTGAEAAAENAKDGKALKPKPGKYKAEIKFVSAEGLPEELQKAMKSGQVQTMEQCVTEEMAKEGFGPPPDQMDSANDSGCKMSKYDIEGNNIEMAMACEGPDGKTTMEMNMTGTVSETKQDLTVVSKGMMGPAGGGSVTMNMKRERIGDCDS